MVTFETKVWEKDWEYLLKGDYLDKLIAAHKYEFSKKQIVINNVNDRALVEQYCKQKMEEGIIDCYYVVADLQDEVLAYFDLSRDSFKGGYNYSIAELVGIYKCETPFLLHYSSDSYFQSTHHNWIDEAIHVMSNQPHIVVANPTWNGKFAEAKQESFDQLDNFYIGYGFSDQCYLIKTHYFKNKIYNETHIESQRYPTYGGELFEKRVDAYMRTMHKHRITHMHANYISHNFPSNWFSSTLFRNFVLKARKKKMNL
jgi:hypothetical protein